MKRTQHIRITPLVLFSMLMLFTQSCDILHNDPEDQVIEVSEEFNVYAVEGYSTSGRTLQFVVETVSDSICSDAVLKVDALRQSELLNIDIFEIDQPDPCLSDTRRLQHTSPLGLLDKNVFEVSLSIKDLIVNQGQIDVYNDEILLSFNEPKGIVPGTKTSYRLPENTIWGYVKTYESDYAGRVLDFITELSSISQSIVLKPGQYSGFEINANGELVFDDKDVSSDVTTFFFKHTGPSSDLSSLLDTYRIDAGAKAEFVIHSTSGEVF